MAAVHKYSPIVQEYGNGQLVRYASSPVCGFSSPGVISTSNGLKSYSYSYKKGWTVDNYHQLMRQGFILPMTPWEQWSWESEATPHFREYCQSNRRHKWFDNYYTFPSWRMIVTPEWVESVMPDVDLEYLVQKAASKISSAGWDALTFIAELKQLRNMLTGVFQKLSRLSRGLSPGEIHNLWLEGRYGWRTLTYDIRDFASAIQGLNEQRSRYKERSGETHSQLITDEGVISTGLGNMWHSSQTQLTVNARGTVIADIDIPDFQFNPLTTAWEVTKLSFVVDWLVNVGQALNALTFSLRVKQYAAAGGYRVDITSTGEAGTDTVTGGVTMYQNESSYHASGYLEKRVPLSVSSVPRLKLRLDEWKILDLISLVLQRIK